MLKKILIFSSFLTLLNAYECKYLDTFKEAGKKYEIDYRLLCSLAKVESHHNPYAMNIRSKDFDVGIMQINTWWFNKLRARGMYDDRLLLDYEFNIDVGSWILKSCIQDFGTTTKAIDCYNKGNYKARNDSDYVRKVLIAYQYFIRKYE